MRIEDIKELEGEQTFNLVVRQDDVTGENGWCLEELAEISDMPSVALDPYLIAHDLIEHVNGVNNIGGIGEEFQALGGSWRTRGQHGDIRRDRRVNNDPYENVAADITNLVRRFLLGPEEIGCNVPSYEDCGFEEDIRALWNTAKKSLRYELEGEDLEPSRYIEIKTAFESLFSLGVRKHEKLYPRSLNATNLFYEIVESLNDIITEVDDNYVITLTINYDAFESSANINYGESDLYDLTECTEKEISNVFEQENIALITKNKHDKPFLRQLFGEWLEYVYDDDRITQEQLYDCCYVGKLEL